MELIHFQLVNDGPSGSPLPTFLTNSSNYDAAISLANQTISWVQIPDILFNQGWNGFSLLVDDVERYVGNTLNFSLAGLEAGLPHFFRLAVCAYASVPGLLTLMEYFLVRKWRKCWRFYHASNPVVQWDVG